MKLWTWAALAALLALAAFLMMPATSHSQEYVSVTCSEISAARRLPISSINNGKYTACR